MALLDKAYKQRMVGALVLVALAVIFLPMLFSLVRTSSVRCTVEAPAAPQAPVVPQSARSSPWLGSRAASRCRRSQCQRMKKSQRRRHLPHPLRRHRQRPL
jgi:hypothetical protein